MADAARNNDDEPLPPDKIPADADGQETFRPPQPDWTHPKARADQEYVSGSGYAYLQNYLRALPDYIDDLTRDLGADLYERMTWDSQVFACLHVLKLMVLAEGYQLHPAKHADEDEAGGKADPDEAKEDTADAKLAHEIRDWCHWNLKNIGTQTGQPLLFEGWLYEMMDALYQGHRVSEKTYGTVEDGPYEGNLGLRLLKTKPRQATAFVTDVYLNLLGLLAIIPGLGTPVLTGTIVADPGQIPNLVPREKFCVLTWMPKESDPRGRSILRAAYDPWWRKMQTKGEELKFLAQAAAPSAVGTTSEGAQSQPAALDSNGNPIGSGVITPEQSMVNALEALKNGACIAVPYGSEVKWLTSGADGSVFRNSMDRQDKEITLAILCETLATLEGQHQARAASQTHKQVLDTVVGFIKRWLEQMVRRDLLYYLVLYNYGKRAADELTPEFKLGGQAEPVGVDDVAKLATALYLDPSQFPALDKRLGLPTRAPAPPPQPAPAAGQNPGQPPAPAGAPAYPGAGAQPAGATAKPNQWPPHQAGFAADPPPPAAVEVAAGDVARARVLWRKLQQPPRRRRKKRGAA